MIKCSPWMCFVCVSDIKAQIEGGEREREREREREC